MEETSTDHGSRASDSSVADGRVALPTEPGLYWAQGVIRFGGEPFERLDVIRITGDPPFMLCEIIKTGSVGGRIVNSDMRRGVGYWNKFTKIESPNPLPGCRGRTPGI